MVDFRARAEWVLWCALTAAATALWAAAAFDDSGVPSTTLARALWVSPAPFVLLLTWWRGLKGLLPAVLGVAIGASIHGQIADEPLFDLATWGVAGAAVVVGYASAGLWLRRTETDLGRPVLRDVVRFVIVAVAIAPVLVGAVIVARTMWDASTRDQFDSMRALATIDMTSIVVIVPVASLLRIVTLRRSPRITGEPIRQRLLLTRRTAMWALAALFVIAAAVAAASLGGVRADVLVGALLTLALLGVVEERRRDDSRASRANSDLELGRAHMRSLMASVPDGVLLLDALGRVESANELATRIFGGEAGDQHALDGSSLLELVPPAKGVDASAHLVEALSSHRDGSGNVVRVWDARTLDGRAVSVELSVTRTGSAHRWGYLATVREVTDRRRREQQLAHRATHDELTQLPNRVLFQDRLEQALAGLHGKQTGMAVLLIDVDRAEIDRMLGVLAGDRVFVEVAHRVQSLVRATDTVARLGDRELAVLFTPCHQPSDATDLAGRLTDQLALPHERLPVGLAPRSHIGVVTTTDADARPDHLLAAADLALDRARNDARRWATCEPTIDARERSTAQSAVTKPREIDLRDEDSDDPVFTSDNVVVRYQPILDLATGRATAVEALARLRRDDGVLLSPAQFVPHAEQAGLVEQLSAVLLPQALDDLLTLRNEEHSADLYVTVNIAPRQLTQTTVDLVADCLREASLPGSALMLEITETGPIEANGATLDVVRQLRALGVGIAFDDFGRGFSRLDVIREMPLDALKIDRVLVHGLADSAFDRDIVEMVVSVGRRRGLMVVAEGVETIDQVDAITRLGCTHAQGYLFGQPMDIEELRYLLREWMIVPAIAAHPVIPTKDH